MQLGGLTCPSCLTKIEKSVAGVAGTSEIKVLFNAGKVKFTLDPSQASTTEIQHQIEKMGYEVQRVRTKEVE